jgi:hypothetical protein
MLLGLHGVSGVADGEALWCVSDECIGVKKTVLSPYE